MSQVIANLYEVQEKIGAGGGGVVYLGQHLRLEKKVVLKADKRSIDTETEKLRREVDILKGLSHTYIPQVYDYVQEDGVVYTVMDYIDGESFDKILERKQKLSQQQIIKWACQLLQALSYLHNHPPHGILHGDIKPANIMLRPNGDVCLIDFNIALALGADGAVKVGFSRGYASPEHYGISYISDKRAAAAGQRFGNSTHRTSMTVKKSTENESDETLILPENEKTAQSTANKVSYVRSTTSDQGSVKLDVRSDIYSLGATLYHLLSGKRPAQDALNVEPLSPNICSPSVSEIIRKSMDPDSDLRYQSADEMLDAFLQLYKTDKRVIRHKKHIKVAAVFISALFLVGGSSTFIGLKQLEQQQKALTLAEYSSNALAEGNVSGAVEKALEAIPKKKSIFNTQIMPQVQLALTDALGVYDLADGFKNLNMIELASAPFDIVASPEGKYYAAVYAYEVTIFETESQKKIAVLPIETSALSDVIFLGESYVAYAGEQGVSVYDIEAQSVLWTGSTATTLSASADKTKIAAVNRDESYVIVYNTSNGTKIVERSFGDLRMSVPVNDTFADPKNSVFALNNDGSMLAVSFSNGGLFILDLHNPDNDIIIFEESDYECFKGGFCGNYFAFCANNGDKPQFGLIDIKEAAYIAGYESQDDIFVQANENGIYVANGRLLVKLDTDTFKEQELAYTDNAHITNFSVGDEYVLIATDDNSFSFFDKGANLVMTETCDENCDFTILANNHAIIGNRNEPLLRLLELETHEEEQFLEYDARYIHEEARISHDEKNIMLFSYKGFCIYDMEGNFLLEKELPDSENIYDQQFRRNEDKSWLEVVWYDGIVRCYDASDGTMISEEIKEKPSKDLYEEFLVGKYKITSSLHSAPEVYDADTDKLITVLEEKSYLTYVTQTEDYIITEYISAEGERYGILLDSNFQKLAYLPGLCDVIGDRLVFDYGSGSLRQCRLYSVQELIALGEKYIEKTKEEN